MDLIVSSLKTELRSELRKKYGRGNTYRIFRLFPWETSKCSEKISYLISVLSDSVENF